LTAMKIAPEIFVTSTVDSEEGTDAVFLGAFVPRDDEDEFNRFWEGSVFLVRMERAGIGVAGDFCRDLPDDFRLIRGASIPSYAERYYGRS